MIRDKLNDLNISNDPDPIEETLPITSTTQDSNPTHIYIGSPQLSQTFEEVEKSHSTDTAFQRFRIELGKHFNHRFKSDEKVSIINSTISGGYF